MSKWIDICVRESSSGVHYLLQMKVKKSGRKVFRNRAMDRNPWALIYTLFHGTQGVDKALKADEVTTP